jgi:hypothetical protein
VRIVWSITDGCLCSEYVGRNVSDIANRCCDEPRDIPNVSSKVHFSIKHGCRIAVEFLELHWHSASKRPQPIRGKAVMIHSSCPG